MLYTSPRRCWSHHASFPPEFSSSGNSTGISFLSSNDTKLASERGRSPAGPAVAYLCRDHLPEMRDRGRPSRDRRPYLPTRGTRLLRSGVYTGSCRCHLSPLPGQPSSHIPSNKALPVGRRSAKGGLCSRLKNLIQPRWQGAATPHASSAGVSSSAPPALESFGGLLSTSCQERPGHMACLSSRYLGGKRGMRAAARS